VSLGRYDTTDAVGGVLQGGLESLRFLQTTGAPLISIQGTLRLARESVSSPTASDYVSATFSTGSSFAAGAGLTVGDHVITTMGTGNPFGATAGAQPIVTVEAGGYFNMSDAANARSPFIRSLAGAGTVTCFSSNGAQTSTLTINPQDGDLANFSGNIVDGSTLTAVVSTAASPVILTKTGAGTQTLSGNNNYSGTTTISAGILKLAKQASLYNNTPANWTNAKIVVNSGAILAFNVGGTGEFTSSDIATLSALGTASGGFKSGSKLGLDTTDAGGTFTYSNVLANPNAGANALGLRKIGTGILVLDQINTYTGGTIIEGGTIKTVQPGGIHTGSLALSPGTSFEADFSALVAAGQITNTTTGSGTISATPPNASQLGFTSGTLTGFAGTINVKPSPASSGRVDFNGLIGTGSTLNIDAGATARLASSSTYSGVTVNVSGTGGSGPGALRMESGTLDSTCAINLLSSASIGGFTVTSTIDATIADGGNGYSLTKSGDSTLFLTAPNTYTGGTNVNGGTLRISKPYLANSSAIVLGSTAVLDLDFDETNGQVSDTVSTLTIGATQKAAGTYGATGSGAANIDDEHFDGIGTLTVLTGPAPSGSFATWAADNGIPGQPFGDDFDNDGISNGVEYALGKSPTVSSQPPGIFALNKITFTKGVDAITNGDISWVIETSTTLAAGSWTAEVTQPAGDTSPTIFYDFTPGNPVKKFARLKVVQVIP
jgi:autotransporter-associated beta strand protein